MTLHGTTPTRDSARNYLGFDRNRYPGDSALELLRKSFFFCGYWLNTPPSETSNTWQGKREVLASHGFGFLILFNGRLYRQLKPSSNPGTLGGSDADSAIEAAKKEGFPMGAVIFLDQEEGGRMLPEQRAYLFSWIDRVNASSYQAGVYCSGMPAKAENGSAIITANDIRDKADGRKIEFVVYNDMCPPSPGCAFSISSLSPRKSGVSFANVWQFALSPKRRFAASCPANYNPDGYCYSPFAKGHDRMFVDIDSATSPDPSRGRLE